MPAMKFVKPVTFVLMALAAGFSVWSVSIGKPTSVGAFLFFSAWLVSPYLVLSAALILQSAKGRSAFHRLLVAAVVTVGGVLLLADVMFWHKDAQGAIAMLMVPIFQGAAYVVLLLIAIWVSRNPRR
jgi:hypothetical protein